jgi:hypothetical protein
MGLLGALECGIYVEVGDDDECHGMSIAQIHQNYGLEALDEGASDDEMSVKGGEQCQADNVGDEDSMSDDEDWLACPSGSEDEELDELDDPDVVFSVFIFWVYVNQTILGPLCGAV